MAEKKAANFSDDEHCGHCGNTAPMEIVARHSEVRSHDHDGPGLVAMQWDAGPVYELLKCPACRGIMLRSYVWHSEFPDECRPERLYPVAERMPQGLPEDIRREFSTATKVKHIDANLFGVQLGRVLELAVLDQKVDGKTLHDRLGNLAKRGDIPARLVDAASGLRKLRNIGAHASRDLELTPAEVPILDSLCLALLEYLYTAPFLVQEVEQRLSSLRAKKGGG